MQFRRAAAIDIGSNTTLFLIAEVAADGTVNPIEEAQIYNGIGTDVFSTGGLLSETLEKNVEILRGLGRKAEEKEAEEIIIVGTSALRQAVNAELLKQRIKSELNLNLQIISGEEEANLTYWGFLSGGKVRNNEILLADIGGGSSELIRGSYDKIIFKKSVDIGAVRLGREFDLGDPPDLTKYRRMPEALKRQLTDLADIDVNSCEIVFSGGTASSLAAIKHKSNVYDGKKVEGTILDYHWIEETQNMFVKANLAGRKVLLPFDPDRAPVIIYGTAIILTLMKLWRKQSAIITNRGLRYGLLSQWGINKFNI